MADHEEADMLLHILSAKMCGYERCVIECSDTDVLILLIHFKDYLTKELWLKVGKGNLLQYIPIHK